MTKMKTNSRSLILSFCLVLLYAVSFNANAKPFAEACPDIPACAKEVGALLGQHYIYDADIKGAIKSTPGLELTKENAELLFTKALDMNNLARVLLASPNTYQIMRQRDARDSALPIFIGDIKNPPKLPETWDLLTFRYQTTNPEQVDDMARNLRSFMPANSRIIPMEASGQVVVTDTSANMKKVYELLVSLDVKISPELRKRREEREKRDRKYHESEMRRSPRGEPDDSVGPSHLKPEGAAPGEKIKKQ